VVLARPRLLVADEPTSGLDAVLKLRMIALMLEAAGPDCAVVLVSHDLPAIAPFCHRIAVMDEGRVVETFTTEALRSGTLSPSARTNELLVASGLSAGVP
jgi:peptide/nickel transport system ATP-binding protein